MGRCLRTIGTVVDACVKESTEAWYREHGGYRSREEAFADGIREILSTSSSLPYGRLRVTVSIVAKRSADARLDFYSFQRRGSEGYIAVEKAEAKV